MASQKRFRENTPITSDDLLSNDVIPIEHDPSGTNDADKSLALSELKTYIITDEATAREEADTTLQGNIDDVQDNLDDLEDSIIGDSATAIVEKAKKDASGNVITTTYAPLANPAFTGSATIGGLTVPVTGTLENNKPVVYDGEKLVSSDTLVPIVDNLTSSATTSALSANQGRVLAANSFGNGTATIDNDTGLISVTLSNYPLVTSLEEGARFRVVFTNAATMETTSTLKYTMSVNGGTAKNVTIGNVEAGIGCFQADKSYEFISCTSFDCLSSTIIEKGTNSSGTWIKYVSGKIKMYGSANITTSGEVVNLPKSLKSTSLNDTICNINTDSPRMYRVQIVTSTSIKIYLETWEGVFWQANSRWCLEQE